MGTMSAESAAHIWDPHPADAALCVARASRPNAPLVGLASRAMANAMLSSRRLPTWAEARVACAESLATIYTLQLGRVNLHME